MAQKPKKTSRKAGSQKRGMTRTRRAKLPGTAEPISTRSMAEQGRSRFPDSPPITDEDCPF